MPEPTSLDTPRTSVFLIDDSRVARAGLVRLLQATGAYEVVGVDSDLARALPRLAALRPERILFDPYANRRNPHEALRCVRTSSDGLILVVTLEERRAAKELSCDEALRAIVSKESEPDEILRALRALNAGRTHVCARIARWRDEESQPNATGKLVPHESAYDQLPTRPTQFGA